MAISFKNRSVRLPVLLAVFVVLIPILTALPENVPRAVEIVVIGVFVVVVVVMEFYFC